MPRWRVPAELLITGATRDGATRWAERALGASVAKDADFYRAIGRRPPRYVLGAIRPEAAPLPRRTWLPRRLP
jgi:hypothetical protein